MAITDLVAMKAMVHAAEQLHFFKDSTGNNQTASAFFSSWMMPPGAPTAPSTSALTTNATPGALVRQTNAPSGRILRLVQAFLRSGQSTSPQSVFILCDRLAHRGAIVNPATGSAITVDLPVSPTSLARYSVGVMAAIEVYANISAGTALATISYVNQDNSTVTSREVSIGGTGDSGSGRFFPIPLDEGDTSVLRVESVSVTANLTGTIGVTLYKPLFMIAAGADGEVTNANPLLGFGAAYPQIEDDACLFFISRGESATITGPWAGSLSFAAEL